MGGELAVGIDLGGTNFRLGLVDSDGTIHKRHFEEVGVKRDPDLIVKRFTEVIHSMIEGEGPIKGVGVGLPGIVDQEKGVVHQSPHFPGWRDVNFQRIMEDSFGVPVLIDNDANMIALGESWLGAGRKLQDFILITLGTGIGGAIMRKGSIIHGDCGFAGEFGHILIDFNGPSCACGSKGCLEMYASAAGLKQLVIDSSDLMKEQFMEAVNNNYDNITPELLYNRAMDGDIFASTMWKKFGTYLGAGSASLVNALGIMNIVVGGGITKAWKLFINEAKRELKRRTYKKSAELAKFYNAKLGHDAGVLGGAKIVLG